MRSRIPMPRGQTAWGVWVSCLTFATSVAALEPRAAPSEPVPQSTIERFDLYPGSTYPGYGGIRKTPPPGPNESSAAPIVSEGPILVEPEKMVDAGPHTWHPCYSVGIRTWLSWCDSERIHAGPDFIGQFANDQKVLKWHQMTSEVIELNINTLWFDRLLAVAEVGVGAISSGRLRDKEVVIEGNPGLTFESLHPAMDDDLFYFNAELGWRFCECDYFIFDGLAGYQYWREKYVAEGGASVFPPLAAFPPGPYITEQFTWQGFRIGCQSVFLPEPRCVIKSRVMFMPFSHFENEHTGHQNAVLPNPNFTDTAAGGFGVMADIRAAYNLWKGLFVELGYRVWDVGSGDGETRIRFSDGADVQLPFNGAHTTRHGLLFGFSYHF